MRYRLMATYRGVPYEAGIGPAGTDVVLFAACPPPEELGFEPAPGHWRKRIARAEVDALWESRPVGIFRGEPCIVLDDLSDRLHIAYLGTDPQRAAALGYWQVDRGVFELLAARDEVTGLAEERVEKPLRWSNSAPDPGPVPAYPYGTAPWPALSPPAAPAHPGPVTGSWQPPAPEPAAAGNAAILGQRVPGQANGYHPAAPGLMPAAGGPGTGEYPVPPYLGDGGAAPPEPELLWDTGPARAVPPPRVPAASHAVPLARAVAAGQAAAAAQNGGQVPHPGPAPPAAAGGYRPPQERPPGQGRGRAGRRQRVTTRAVFCELADLAAIPRHAYALETEVDGAMCLLQTRDGWEVFVAADGARHEVRSFEEEEAAYFYLFGVLAAEAIRNGGLAPR